MTHHDDSRHDQSEAPDEGEETRSTDGKGPDEERSAASDPQDDAQGSAAETTEDDLEDQDEDDDEDDDDAQDPEIVFPEPPDDLSQAIEAQLLEAQEALESAQRSASDLPEDAIFVVPLRGTVVFPDVVMPITIGRQRSLEAVQEAVRADRPLGFLLQKDQEESEPRAEDLYRIGTVATVLRLVSAPDGHHVICQGQERFHVEEVIQEEPALVVRGHRIPEDSEPFSSRAQASGIELRKLAVEALRMLPQAPSDLITTVAAIDSPVTLANMVATFVDASPEEKQQLLEIEDIELRLERTLTVLSERLEVLKLSQEISQQTKGALDQKQREYFLRQQLETIHKELGDADDKGLDKLRESIASAEMPEEAEAEAVRELGRLERIPEASTEYSMVRSYLEWMVDLPWANETDDNLDITRAREVLNEDHYGLEDIKKRIIQHLAVRKLNPDGKAPILCFVGPPGVGKTSLGRSIARAMEREFARISLGGVHDESEIRGHRRTYVGAMPGRIIQHMRRVGTRNPVFMLDEVDKLGHGGMHGDPSSALLEVLDPEQNDTFRDNYLGVPFDLSKVMFIATANVLDNIPGPLRDRMEVIELSGYTEGEKLEIAKRYLIGRQRKEAGLKEEQIRFADDALREIIRHYTREAGVRNLERTIGGVARHLATLVAEEKADEMTVETDDIDEILGGRKFEREVALRTSVPGVATGLAWTPVGGEILFVEATATRGHGKLILTGQLGDVMKESAQAALTLVKANLERLGVDPTHIDELDIHVHVPAGAIPKDGPSAGVAIYTALASLVTDRTVHSDIGMTGEISLRGHVLPVGGIKEKVLAAFNAGLRTVLLPARNKRHLDEIPDEMRDKMKFVWLETVDDAMEVALGDPPSRDRPAAAEPPPTLPATSSSEWPSSHGTHMRSD